MGVLSCWLGLVVRGWPRRVPGRGADRVSDAAVVQALERECARAGVARCPRLNLVPNGVPRLTGLWRPILELPEAAQEWTEEKLSGVLRHELAHVRRADLRWLVATEAALALVWGHPLRRVLRRRLAGLREEACDDAVIASGMEPAVYAAHLASFLAVAVPASPSCSLPAVQPSGWPGRFRRMLDPNVSRRAIRNWELAVISLLAGMVVVAGTVFVGCAGTREARFAELGMESSDPGPPEPVRSGAQKLSIELKVFEMTVRLQDAPKLGFPEGFPTAVGYPGKILTQEEGQNLFRQGRGATRCITSPKLSAKSGQHVMFESIRPVRYPVEFQPNSETGIMEPCAYEEQKVGVILAAAARPTKASATVHLQYDFKMREHEGSIQHSVPGLTQPVFHTRRIADEIDLVNGSFIIVGLKPLPQNRENFIPERPDELEYQRWGREAGEAEHGQLAAVQVLVKEVKD